MNIVEYQDGDGSNDGSNDILAVAMFRIESCARDAVVNRKLAQSEGPSPNEMKGVRYAVNGR